MKKSIVIAILGGTIAATSAFAQGQIAFNSYVANGGAGGITTYYVGGGIVPDGFTAQLYYALGTVSDPVLGNSDSILSSITGLTPVGIPAIYNSSGISSGAYPGFFTGSVISIPDYTSGAISFEVLTTGTVGGIQYQGRSGSWTMAGINVGSASPGSAITGMPSWQVAPVPEPTTLALAGLGGLASLLVMRRKNA